MRSVESPEWIEKVDQECLTFGMNYEEFWVGVRTGQIDPYNKYSPKHMEMLMATLLMSNLDMEFE